MTSEWLEWVIGWYSEVVYQRAVYWWGRSGNPPEGMKERGIEGINRNKICLNLNFRINYICKIFNHSLIQSFIPFLEFPEQPHWCIKTRLFNVLCPKFNVIEPYPPYPYPMIMGFRRWIFPLTFVAAWVSKDFVKLNPSYKFYILPIHLSTRSVFTMKGFPNSLSGKPSFFRCWKGYSARKQNLRNSRANFLSCNFFNQMSGVNGGFNAT